MFVMQNIIRDSKWQWSLQQEKPAYLNVPEKHVAWFYRNYARRLNNSFTAATMASQFLSGPVKGLSVAKMAEIVAPYLSEKDPVNIYNRIWKPNLPVIHLAMAVMAGTKSELPGSEPQHVLEHLFKSRDLIKFVVDEAYKHQKIIETIPKLRTASAKLTHFQLT